MIPRATADEVFQVSHTFVEPAAEGADVERPSSPGKHLRLQLWVKRSKALEADKKLATGKRRSGDDIREDLEADDSGGGGTDVLEGGAGTDTLKNDPSDTLSNTGGDTLLSDVFSLLPDWLDLV